MDPAHEQQQNEELTALRSIYDHDFINVPPPKAWKDAARLPEFNIKVPHPEPAHAHRIYFHLNTKFPKTYPTLATPIFSIQKPTNGIGNDQCTRLSQAIHVESQKYKGSLMVFEIVSFCQEWLHDNITLKVDAPGSLATEMNKRAMDEEHARQLLLAQKAEEQRKREAILADQLDAQIKEDALRQQLEKERQFKSRARANSDSTAVPPSLDTRSESFGREICFGGVKFDTVKLFHPRKDVLGTIYSADPVCDDVNATLPLELLVIEFPNLYYSSSQGKKKLKQVEAEIQRLVGIRHENLLSTVAVKLTTTASPQLSILSEQRPSLSLCELLEETDALKEPRALDFLRQSLSGLHAIHATDIVHRSLSAKCIGLVANNGPTKILKLGKAAYYQRLLDLHRSNSFGSPAAGSTDEPPIPDAWLPKDVVESPLLYTRTRDLHGLGIVFLQMLMGKDVTTEYPDFLEALRASSVSPQLQQFAMTMLFPARKSHTSCLSLLNDISSSFTALVPLPQRAPMPFAIPVIPKTPMTSFNYGSPELGYFGATPRAKQSTSRWKEDWEELELLGKGAFGSVVKARNKIDNRIYAVKKVRLRTMQSDSKIFREVNALSRLSHGFIVRYYTTWVEVSEPTSAAQSDESESESEDGTEDGMTSVPSTDEDRRPNKTPIPRVHHDNSDPFIIDMDDFDEKHSTGSTSFHGVYFGSSSPGGSGSDSDSSEGGDGDGFANQQVMALKRDLLSLPTPSMLRTLYIQMEFVERQTLKERVDDRMSEEDAWRLFHQIVDALVHMSGLGILHRDIKLTNIFIDGKGDCKVGDFGLATSSLAAVDPSDVSHHATALDADMTLEVGTRLYIAPEVLSRKRGPRNHSKADLYSLGIVFFEMNFHFSTGAERIAVLEDLRKPDIVFPPSWPEPMSRQRQIIKWLLQHDPANRPTALELSQSSLVPARIEDEYFKGALRMMAKTESPHHQAVISSLFSQPPRPARTYLYDADLDSPEHTSLNDIVIERLAALFQLHGAVDIEPPLLMPSTRPEDEKTHATFLDRHGDLVTLPNNALGPFARLAAREGMSRIKRYHISNIFRPQTVPGHPKVTKAAVFDIISPDLITGPIAACAEVLSITNDCLNSFPNLAQNYDIHISHSQIVDTCLNRVPETLRTAVIEIINQSRSTASQKRALLLKKGLLRSTTDELEILAEGDEDIENLVTRLEKISPALVALIEPAVDEVKKTLLLAASAGVTRRLVFRPLMFGNHHNYFKDGIRFEVVRRNKRSDIFAAGGRYDNLITRYLPPNPQTTPVIAVGVQITVEKITSALALYQSTSVKALVKEQRSFGFWSPRRCDVYVVSYHPGYLQERLEVVAYLWQHNISADIMYESGLPEADVEDHIAVCAREGILFTVYPRPRLTRREQPAFKIKSVLKGTEYEVSRQELIGWLQHEIAEQKRVDSTTSGAAVLAESASGILPLKDVPSTSSVQLLLPAEAKKHRKQVKQLFLDRAFETGSQIRTSIQAGMPIIAIDVPPAVFDAMIRSSAWITDDEAWKSILGGFAATNSAYAYQIRDAALRRKQEELPFVLLFAVREERVQILKL